MLTTEPEEVVVQLFLCVPILLYALDVCA